MDLNEQQTAPEAEADTSLTPSETDGASSSDAADEAPESFAEQLLQDFRKDYGEEESEETDEADASAQESEAAAEDAESEQTPEKETDDSDDQEFRIPDEQFKALPDGVRNRLGHLNARAKKAERENADLQKAMEPLKDAHERFTTFQNFVQENDIQPENVTLLFNAAASLSKGDYKSFVEAVQPWYELAQQSLGATIAPDLQQRVDDGYLSAEDAQELTKARATSKVNEGRVESLTARQKADRQAQEAQGAQQEIVSAIQAREAEIQSSDPDYAHKSGALHSMVEFALSNGARPQNKAEALKIINDAYDRVNESFQKPAPPKPTSPRPSVSNPPRGNPEPETTKEAISQALRDMPTA